jgi:transcriptional regulator with XRE-family HTH domain
MKESIMGKLTELRDELMQDPSFKAGYEQQGQLVRFGRMMRAARESQGLTQAALAERVATSQSEISRLEKGEGVNGPTFERIVQLAHALGLQLVGGFADTEPEAGGAGRPGEAALAAGRNSQVVRFARVKREQAGRSQGTADEAEPLWSAF